DLPKDAIAVLGTTPSERIHNMIYDIVKNSYEQPDIIMSPVTKEAMHRIREFMFDNVYIGSKAKDQDKKAQYIIRKIYEYYILHPEKLTGEYKQRYKESKEDVVQIVCDYIAGMTDRYAVKIFENIYIPTSWSIY
ncbi:MAG: deoxyguanosinetriphosphate triphosphohydrolase, partial [Epulopiscium sp.]|nr:deoxyguanosinetriphosphate triphosphohydrolase [Candidatus Epulonipiscium sp.]